MKFGVYLLGGAVLLAACEETGAVEDDPTDRFLQNVPEEVIALAAPDQNLTQITIDPVDNCYVYSHAGPVETTLLPLKTVDERPICAAPPETTEAS